MSDETEWVVTWLKQNERGDWVTKRAFRPAIFLTFEPHGVTFIHNNTRIALLNVPLKAESLPDVEGDDEP